MAQQLALRPTNTYDATTVTAESPDSWTAVETLRAQIPDVDLVRFVRRAKSKNVGERAAVWGGPGPQQAHASPEHAHPECRSGAAITHKQRGNYA